MNVLHRNSQDAARRAALPENYTALGVRRFGRVNWLGMWTLYTKEVQRFIKVWMQTLMAPIITTLLFLAIFSLALAGLRPDINGVPFINFLAPGLTKTKLQTVPPALMRVQKQARMRRAVMHLV